MTSNRLLALSTSEPEAILSLAPSEQREYIRCVYGLKLDDFEIKETLPLLLSEDVVGLYKSGISDVMDYAMALNGMSDFEKLLLDFILLHPTKKYVNFYTFVEQVEVSLNGMFEALAEDEIEFSDDMIRDIVDSLIYILNDQLGEQVMCKQDRLTLTGKAIELITMNRALTEAHYTH